MRKTLGNWLVGITIGGVLSVAGVLIYRKGKNDGTINTCHMMVDALQESMDNIKETMENSEEEKEES